MVILEVDAGSKSRVSKRDGIETSHKIPVWLNFYLSGIENLSTTTRKLLENYKITDEVEIFLFNDQFAAAPNLRSHVLGDSDRPQLCFLQKYSGKGKLDLRRWFYDSELNLCKQFKYYGGEERFGDASVGGIVDSNNFNSFQFCESTCKVQF